MSTTWRRRAASRPNLVEVAMLAALFAITITGCFVTRWVTKQPLPLWPGIALVTVACLALRCRRGRPLPVLAVTTLSTMGVALVGYLLTPLLMGPLLVAQYSVSLRTGRRATWNSALAVVVAMAVPSLFVAPFRHSVLVAVVNPAAWVLLVAAFGSYVRVRREYAAARAEHAAREREEEARHRVIQERMRIARELHDVVAHHLTLANAQATTAAHVSRTSQAQACAMLDNLSRTTAAALRELKATVGLLRQDTDPGDGLAPAPGLQQLPDLVAACSAAGLDVTVTETGEPRPLTTGVDLTAYRIIQEALTNVTKHAGTRTAEVSLAYTSHDLTLTITNDASTPAPAPAPATGSGAGSVRGFGLRGMRERALAVGGTCHAGPSPHGGFEVSCTLPFTGSDESPAS